MERFGRQEHASSHDVDSGLRTEAVAQAQHGPRVGPVQTLFNMPCPGSPGTTYLASILHTPLLHGNSSASSWEAGNGNGSTSSTATVWIPRLDLLQDGRPSSSERIGFGSPVLLLAPLLLSVRLTVIVQTSDTYVVVPCWLYLDIGFRVATIFSLYFFITGIHLYKYTHKTSISMKTVPTNSQD